METCALATRFNQISCTSTEGKGGLPRWRSLKCVWDLVRFFHIPGFQTTSTAATLHYEFSFIRVQTNRVKAASGAPFFSSCLPALHLDSHLGLNRWRQDTTSSEEVDRRFYRFFTPVTQVREIRLNFRAKKYEKKFFLS